MAATSEALGETVGCGPDFGEGGVGAALLGERAARAKTQRPGGDRGTLGDAEADGATLSPRSGPFPGLSSHALWIPPTLSPRCDRTSFHPPQCGEELPNEAAAMRLRTLFLTQILEASLPLHQRRPSGEKNRARG